MIIIRTVHDLSWLEQKQRLPNWYLDHLREFFMLLFTASNEETNLDAFTLEGKAELVVVEPQDQPQDLCLPILPGWPMLLELDPEVVGTLSVKNHVIYRAMLMPDNEHMIFVFSVAGEATDQVEEWLQDKLTWSELFSGH